LRFLESDPDLLSRVPGVSTCPGAVIRGLR
jgi:hypothetical protein